MHKRHHSKNHESDDDQKQQIYEKFSKYVRNELRDTDNPNICVQEFDLMPRSGAYHMQCVLQNVNIGKAGLFKSVESFAEGAKLKIIEDVENKNGGGNIYTAFIPFKTLSRGGGGGRRGEGGWAGGAGGQPNTMHLIGYMSGLMGLFVFAVVKTSWADWRFLF
jgi:hypothetical protein